MESLKKFLQPLGDWLYAYMVRMGLAYQATDTMLTISMITNEALMVLENELTFAAGINREYDDSFGIDGAKIGDTINVRRPARFVGTSGPNLAVEDFYESSVPVVVGDTAAYGDQFHVDTSFTTKDLRLSLGAFSDRVLRPAVAAVANKIDYVGLTMAKNKTGNTVGTPGTPNTNLSTYLSAAAYLDSEGAPRTNGARQVCIDQWGQVAIVDALKGLFTPVEKIGAQYRKGQMGRDSAGMDWVMDQNVNVQNYGYWASSSSTLTVNTVTIGISSGWAATSTLTIAHGASITLNQGDSLTFADVFPVNPQNRQRYGTAPRPFTVQTTVSGTGSSTMQVVVSPAVITAGQFQNVTIPTTSASATVTPLSIGTSGTGTASPTSILCHKNAFTLAMVDLPLPSGVVMAGRASSKEAGLSMRIVRQYTINNDQIPARVDSLWGWGALYQELACRIAG